MILLSLVLFTIFVLHGVHRSRSRTVPSGSQASAEELAHARPLSGQQLLDAVKAHHPINRLQCGPWVQKYQALHKAILEGRAPQRYVVFRSQPEFANGLADRLASSVSIFFYALLTDRAFLYDWNPPLMKNTEEFQREQLKVNPNYVYHPPPAHLWSALRSDFVDWRVHGWRPDEGNSSILMDYHMDVKTAEYKAHFLSEVSGPACNGTVCVGRRWAWVAEWEPQCGCMCRARCTCECMGPRGCTAVLWHACTLQHCAHIPSMQSMPCSVAGNEACGYMQRFIIIPSDHLAMPAEHDSHRGRLPHSGERSSAYGQ